MSHKAKQKKQRRHPHHGGATGPQTSPLNKNAPDNSWEPFISYNSLEAPLRQEALKRIGIIETDRAVIGILSKSHFVIPGTTRFECQQCGECCRYARKVAQLTYEPCLYLSAENTCSKHDKRYLVCKWFPFWIYNHRVYGPLLTIKPYCTGYGKGSVVDYGMTVKRIQELSLVESKENDGAFVIHEVLLIPGSNDWAFPSKRNVDALMAHIWQEARKTSDVSAVPHSIERDGEVHYAYHVTSGLLGNIHAPMVTVNEKSMITDVNEPACRLFNRDRRQMTGSSFSSFFINPDRVASSIASCFSHGKETASPQRLRLPDETALPVLLNALTFRDRSDGMVRSILIGITQVSASVFTEVSQSRTYARGLLETSLDALMVIDKDGGIIDVNESLVEISGRPRDKLLGMAFKDLFVDREKAVLGVESTFKNGKVRAYDLVLENTEGVRIPVSFNATVYRDAEGVVQGIFAAARDIRERLKMFQDLENAKNYARGLIECCLDLMVTINRDGLITDANNAAIVMTGKNREDLVGSRFSEYFSDCRRAQQGVERTFSEGRVRNYELDLIAVGGSAVPVVFNASLYRDAQGKVLGVFAIARTKE